MDRVGDDRETLWEGYAACDPYISLGHELGGPE